MTLQLKSKTILFNNNSSSKEESTGDESKPVPCEIMGICPAGPSWSWYLSCHELIVGRVMLDGDIADIHRLLQASADSQSINQSINQLTKT